MTIDEIFSSLSAHMIKGLMIHDKLAAAFGFIGLYGYQACHEHHYYSESYNYKQLQNYFLSHYNKLIPETSVQIPEIIPNGWYKYSRQDVNTSTVRTAARDLLKFWVDWETETKRLLENSYKLLYDNGDIDAALYIGEILKNNSVELAGAQEQFMTLEISGYDIVAIIDKQQQLYDTYKNKEKEG